MTSQAVRRLFAATDNTPFDLTYPVREAVVEAKIDPGGGGYRNFARDAMALDAKAGVGYEETSVGLGKLAEKFPEDMMRELQAELAALGLQADVRFLAMVSTKALVGEARPKEVFRSMSHCYVRLRNSNAGYTEFEVTIPPRKRWEVEPALGPSYAGMKVPNHVDVVTRKK